MSSLAMIVPLYNPHNDWFDALSDAITGLDKVLNNVDYSIVLVNDGSTNFDESYIEKLKSGTNKVKYFSYPVNQGKGYSIRYGLSRVQADFYVYTDIDFPFGYEAILNMYNLLNTSSTNLIIGVRSKEYFKLLPFKRKMLSKILHSINYLITGFKVHDTQAGIKGFDNVAKKIFLETKTNGFLFDLEFIHSCLRKRLKYTTMNIQPRPNIKFSEFRTAIIMREFKNLNRIIFRF